MSETGHQREPGFARIEPARIDLASAPAAADAPRSRRPGVPLLAGLGFGLLLAIAAAVIFLLPRWVAPPETPVPTVTPESAAGAPRPAGAAPSTPAKAPGTPWEQAQETEQRRQSQAILEKLLEAQKLLAGRGVTEWANDEFQQALKLAKDGDERYNQRDFAGAREQYQRSLDLLEALQQRVDTVFDDALAHGRQALADDDSAAAKSAFDLALAIDPLDRAASAGRDRAENLDAVHALLRQGDRLLDDGQLEAARDAYRQALDLDAQTERAKQQIAVVERKLGERAFNRRMSAGFEALYAGEPQQAKASFAAALKLRPGSQEARDALAQSEHALQARAIAGLLDEAQAFEADERWHDALDRYRAALDLDPALAAAQQGRDRSAVRARIHDRLEQILAHPERLYDPDVLDDVAAFHGTVSAVEHPGPRLTRQVAALGALLHKMREPVTVHLQSDNETRVTLYRVGELGQFTRQDIRLRPGRYVAVGVREGYRDVRVEFTVDPDRPVPVVRISADEKVAFGEA